MELAIPSKKRVFGSIFYASWKVGREYYESLFREDLGMDLGEPSAAVILVSHCRDYQSWDVLRLQLE